MALRPKCLRKQTSLQVVTACPYCWCWSVGLFSRSCCPLTSFSPGCYTIAVCVTKNRKNKRSKFCVVLKIIPLLDSPYLRLWNKFKWLQQLTCLLSTKPHHPQKNCKTWQQHIWLQSAEKIAAGSNMHSTSLQAILWWHKLLYSTIS